MEEEMGWECKVESSRGVWLWLSDTLTQWRSKAHSSQITVGEEGRGGEGGISSNSREEKTGRLTEWGSEGITAARNNPSKPTGTVQYACVYVRACCLFVGFFATYKLVQMRKWRTRPGECYLQYVQLKLPQFPYACMQASDLQYCVWEDGLECKESVLRKGREIGHGAPLKPCAANQLQLVPHPYKDSLMWARPLTSTLGSHKAAPALIWVRRNLLLFLLHSNKALQNSSDIEKSLAMVSATSVTLNLLRVHLPSYIFFLPFKNSPLCGCVLSPRA